MVHGFGKSSHVLTTTRVPLVLLLFHVEVTRFMGARPLGRLDSVRQYVRRHQDKARDNGYCDGARDSGYIALLLTTGHTNKQTNGHDQGRIPHSLRS